MSSNPLDEMQKAVDIVVGSPHPYNKIAATIAGTDKAGRNFSLSRTNYWPAAIEKALGREQRIGSSSGTIHAETACILAAPATEGANLFVTDPFCPNCAKNISEAGIKAVYIDHKGFMKDFAVRRGDHFESMSLRICEKAGIAVYEIRRKDRVIEPLYKPEPRYIPINESPAEIERTGSADEDTFSELVALKRGDHRGRRFATSIARDHKGSAWAITARSHPAIGYSHAINAEEIFKTEDKYSFILEPVNRLLMNAARHGLKIVSGLVYSSSVPTAREQVNLLGAGITSLYIGDTTKARDSDSLSALRLLSKNDIISVQELSL